MVGHPIGKDRAPTRRGRREATPDVIVLADEDDIVNELLAHRLHRVGFHTRMTTEGDEIQGLVGKGNVRAVVLSVDLPGRSGFEILQTLGADPETRHIPIVLLVWPGNSGHVVRGLRKGAADVVEKPFVPDEMIARIARLIPAPNLLYS